MSGRPPKPSALKEAEGNPGKRALNDNEWKPRPVAPRMPAGLLPEAEGFWKRVAPLLESAQLLTEADGQAFELMATHYALARRAARELRRANTLTNEDENGVARKHPLLQIYRDNSAQFRQWAQLFGLTPTARAKLSVPEPEDDDDAFFDD
jgi:P27 family predicted phage terminase small subunit